MNNQMKKAADAVLLMEQYLKENLVDENGNLQEQKLWENTYIAKQIAKRKNGGIFSMEDHIRAMVYSMLSAMREWKPIEVHIATGEIDEIFCQYDAVKLLQCKPEKLSGDIKGIRCGSQLTDKQMEALVHTNIKKLVELEERYGSIDTFYQRNIEEDPTVMTLVSLLSGAGSKFKLEQMGEALVAEYLRNVGYDIAKPDSHIQRILGSEILGCSNKKEVPVYEAFDMVAEIARELNKPVAEVDYILWSYCANRYGEVCTSDERNCEKCVIKQYCGKKKEN